MQDIGSEHVHLDLQESKSDSFLSVTIYNDDVYQTSHRKSWVRMLCNSNMWKRWSCAAYFWFCENAFDLDAWTGGKAGISYNPFYEECSKRLSTFCCGLVIALLILWFENGSFLRAWPLPYDSDLGYLSRKFCWRLSQDSPSFIPTVSLKEQTDEK